MVLTREDFAELSLSELLNNIWLDAEFVIRGNCKSFFDDYIDFCIDLLKENVTKVFKILILSFKCYYIAKNLVFQIFVMIM